VTRIVRNDGRGKRPINMSHREIALDYLANCTREEPAPECARELGPCRVGLDLDASGYALRIGLRRADGKVFPRWPKRWIKEQLHGAAPEGLRTVCLCGVKACVEPNHHKWGKPEWTWEKSTKLCSCGTEFVGTSRARLCPGCLRERRRAHMREYSQRPEVRAKYIANREAGVNAARYREQYKKNREKRIAWQRAYYRRKQAEKTAAGKGPDEYVRELLAVFGAGS
jgi:hypothetical protein